MRNTVLILLISALQVFATGSYAQTKKISLAMNDATIREVLYAIQKQSEFYFLYNSELIDVTKKVDITIEEEKVDAILTRLFNKNEADFLIKDRYIVLTPVGGNVELFAIQQQRSVSGKVTDSNNKPLPGVTVVVKGTTQGTVTNADGNYSISNVPEDATLVFSFVGMRTQEVVVGNQTSINVRMKEETIGIEEVVAIGYGTQTVEERTSAAVNLNEDDFVKGAVTNPIQLIRGQVAGLNIITPNANPTSVSQILLRGVSTLASGTQPLILVDGIPGSLREVAPEDIESIAILKDGSAAAIYGTRGTNGVVLITTKKINRETPASIEYNSYLTTQIITRELEFMNAEEFRELAAQGKPGAIDFGSSTDWTDQIYRTPISQSHNLSLKGGSENTNYIANFNYQALEGLILKSDNNTQRIRLEANHTMFDGKLRVNANIIGYQRKYFSGSSDGNWRGDVYRNAIHRNPTEPVYDEEGNFFERTSLNQYYNPVGLIKAVDGISDEITIKPFGSITLIPIEGLYLKLLLSRDIGKGTINYAESSDHVNSILQNRLGYASRRFWHTYDDLLETTANYKNTFNNYHNLNFLAGYGYQAQVYDNFGMSNYDFPSDFYKYNNMGAGLALNKGAANMSSNKSSNRLVSYFARINYNYDYKYLLMASVRYEGSTKFGKKHKWGYFPAVSAGWNIIKEPFMSDFGFFSALKIRGGYGITGTAPSSTYASQARLSYGSKYLVNDEWIPVIQPSSNPNPDLRWEKKEEINFGIEMGAYNNRIFATLDFYKRTTRDLLWNYNVALPPFLYNTVLANAGTMENKGIEVKIDFVSVKTSSLNWNTSLNYSSNKNKLIRLSNEQYQIEGGYFMTDGMGFATLGTHRVEVGKPIGNFYGYKSIDIDEDGYWIIEDKNGNPKQFEDVVPDDRKVIGNGLPKHYLNLNNIVRYKQFELSITMRGAFGFQIFNHAKARYSLPVQLIRGNVMKGSYDDIYGKRPLNDIQQDEYVSYFLKDGDYWKIDNITLSYTLDIAKGPIKNIMLYASGSNMFTITGYDGIDPEVNSVGLQPGWDNRDRYPSTRTYTLGLTAKF